MQSDKLSKTLMCVFLLAMFVIIADSSHGSQEEFSQNSLIQAIKNPMTTKCMINNCLACPQGLPYTCSTCKENATCCSHFCKKCTQQKPTECAECQPGYTYNSQTKNCVLQDSCDQTYCADCVTDADGRRCIGCMSDSVLVLWTNTCEKCPVGCYLCNVEMECSSCDGHYFKNGTVCEQCDTFCGQCQNRKDYCLSCPVSYYLIQENHTCAKCMDHCANCEKKEQCKVCDLYYFYNEKTQKCQMCGQYCLICKSVGECIKCDNDHYMNQTEKYCNTCDQVIKNCKQCTKPDDFSISNKQILSQVSCLECFPGYYRSIDKCLPCSSHCIKCQNSMSCLECEMKYVVNPVTRMCDQCNIQRCMKCQSATVCLFCQPGYFWNNITVPGMCFKCKTGCSGCGINYCYECDKGYYLNEDQCLKCNSQCGSCDKNASKCITCVVGYFLPQNSNRCLKCPQHCASCMDEKICDHCLVGYMQVGRSCVKCSMENCGYCAMIDSLEVKGLTNDNLEKTDYENQVCKQCIPGYYLNSSNTCSSCPSHCKLCDNSTLCKSCQKGYALNTNQCTPCIQHCNNCQINPNTWHSDCVECQFGYYLNQTSLHCQKCTTANCSKCNQNRCYQCAEGYFLKVFGQNCTKCMDNCTQCIDDKRCLACKEGFWWDVNGWKCVECGQKCRLCMEGGGCVLCRDGFRVGNDGKCEQCTVKGCGKCDQDKKQCEECLVGYVMENKTNDFSELEVNQTMICFKCGQQSLLGCSECQSSTKCTSCIQGYQLNSNSLCAPEQKTEKVIWPYVLIIAILSLILIGLGVFKLKKKLQGKSLSKLMKLQKDSQDPQNYHKLQDLVIN